MKSRYVIPAFALLLSMSAIAQKDQLKALEKATKNFDATNVKNTLMAAEAAVANADDSDKAQFYYLKGNALFELSKNNVEAGKNLVGAAQAYQESIAIEKKIGKSKYSNNAESSLQSVKDNLINSAVEDNKNDLYKEGTIKLYEAYKISPKDTVYLYYAANGAIRTKDYDTAIEYLGKLKDLNYTGKTTEYYAVDKGTKKEALFSSKSERDLYIKAGSHESPRDEKVPSVRGEIYRNYSILLAEKGQIDKALSEIQEARKLYPNDSDFVMIEADFYNRKGDNENYVRIIKEASEKAPNDPDLLYNLGVASLKMDKKEDAVKYFNQTVSVKPDYVNAYINLANIKVDEQAKIFEEMNSLGNSQADNKKYNDLMAKKNKLLEEAIPYLETALKYKPNNLDILTLMTQIYPTLGMDAKYKETKDKIDEINANK
jgi:tetratricopeptide (TPR) repeat protein